MLNRIVKTYSIVFTGYVISHGIQVVLFSTTDRNQVESLCKEYVPSYPKIYIDEVFCMHSINVFKL